MDYIIRNMREDERCLLEEFLYQAIYVPESFEGEVPRDIVRDDPKCRAAYEGFGSLPDDRALVAVAAPHQRRRSRLPAAGHLRPCHRTHPRRTPQPRPAQPPSIWGKNEIA